MFDPECKTYWCECGGELVPFYNLCCNPDPEHDMPGSFVLRCSRHCGRGLEFTNPRPVLVDDGPHGTRAMEGQP